MLNSQLFAQCGHLWPSSVFKHSPVDGFQIFTTLSSLPLASSPPLDHDTLLTGRLPFPQMLGNTFVMVVYASPPLSGGEATGMGLSHALCNNTRTKKHDTRKDMGIITDGQLAFGTRGRSQRSTLRPHSLRHERV